MDLFIIGPSFLSKLCGTRGLRQDTSKRVFATKVNFLFCFVFFGYSYLTPYTIHLTRQTSFQRCHIGKYKGTEPKTNIKVRHVRIWSIYFSYREIGLLVPIAWSH